MNADFVDWFSLAGRRAVVTGGSRGIGRMIAQGMLMAGADVAICARHPDQVASTVSALAGYGSCIGLAADLSKTEGRATVATWIEATYGTLDILINNAGTSWGEDLATFPLEGFEKVLQVNVTSVFDLTRRLLPLIERSATEEKPARIINIGSVDGLRVPSVDNYPYSASKAAIHMLTRHLARALLTKHINVNCIAPGIFETKMTAHWFDETHPNYAQRPAIPMVRAGGLDDIAAAAVYLAAPASTYITGVVLPVAGGISTID